MKKDITLVRCSVEKTNSDYGEMNEWPLNKSYFRFVKRCKHMILFLKVIQDGPQRNGSNILMSVCSFLMFLFQKQLCHCLNLEIPSLVAGWAALVRFIPCWCFKLCLSTCTSTDPSETLSWSAGRQPCKPPATRVVAPREWVWDVFAGGCRGGFFALVFGCCLVLGESSLASAVCRQGRGQDTQPASAPEKTSSSVSNWLWKCLQASGVGGRIYFSLCIVYTRKKLYQEQATGLSLEERA